MSPEDQAEAQAVQDEGNGLMRPALRVIPRTDEIKKVRPWTDLGNAERLVEILDGDARYCVQRRKWLVWEGDKWVWDTGPRMQKFAKKMVRMLYIEAAHVRFTPEEKEAMAHALNSQKARTLRAALELAQNEPGVQIEMDALDADPWLLNCPNGTLDLKTGELREHSREDLITKTTALDYDPDARSDLWDDAIEMTTHGDLEFAQYLQRVAGYACTGLGTERAFWLLYGLGGSGKGTWIDGMHAALGDYADASTAESFLVQTHTGGNRGDIVRLAGVRLVSANEMRKGAKWDEALVKKITGGDLLTYAGKYENEVSFRASFTLVIAVNDCPVARDDDDGFWARCRRVPFQVIPPEKRKADFKQQLAKPEHARAILAWAVRGCLMWQRDGIGTCAAVEASTQEYHDESNHFGDFLEDKCELIAGVKLPNGSLRQAYDQWCQTAGIPDRCRHNAAELKIRLEKIGVVATKSGSTRYWQGIRLQGATS